MQGKSAYQIKHLKDFYSPRSELFQEASQLPQFFRTNLVDDSRVVKYFEDDAQANLRIFYYQYLKLCFEIENVDYESYIQKIYELIRTEGFEFYFEQNERQKQFKNAQYKSLLIDFFEVMNTSSLTIDQVLTQYPILDEVFINFFRSVLMIASVTSEYDSYIDKNDLFDFLSSFFSVDISSYDNCLKFVQSDIFVYEQDPRHIYMAYITDDHDDKGQAKRHNHEQTSYLTQTTNQNPLHTQSLIHQKPYSLSQHASHKEFPEEGKLPIAPSSDSAQTGSKSRAKITIKESYIEGEFHDYTSYHQNNHQNISALGKNVPIDSEKQISETVEHQLTSYQQSSQLHIEVQEIIQTHNSSQQQKQLKRVLSADIHVRFEEEGPIPINQNSSSNLSILNKGNSQPNLLSSQNRMIESICDQLQIMNHMEEKEQVQHQEMSNSKQNKQEITFNLNLLYKNHEEPTKDPGFGSAQAINVRSVQSTISHTIQSKQMAVSYQSNTLVESEESAYKSIKSNFYGQFQKSNNLQEPLFHKPSIPVPTLMNQNSLSANSRMVSSSKPLKDSQNTGIVNLASVKESFKLNVTKEFTSSFVMKSMNEPFKTNVYKIREKAREFRKNIYQQFTYKASTLVSSNQHNLIKSPPSRKNLPSVPTLQKVSSASNLAIDSNIKPQSETNKNPNNPIVGNVNTKEETGTNSSLSQKLFDVKETISSVSKQSSNANISSRIKIQDSVKETLQPSQTQNSQNKIGPTVSLGPAIVATKQSQPQTQFPQVPNSYCIPQTSIYQIPPPQISRPQTYQQGRTQPSSSMFYSNNLQSAESIKIYKEQSIPIYREQPNLLNPTTFIHGYKGQIPRNTNPQDLMYPQAVKKPYPVFVPYERRT